MAAAVRGAGSTRLGDGADDRLYELRGELGLRFARLGWDVRAEVVEAPDGWVVECSPVPSPDEGFDPARIRISLTSEPISSQAIRAVERVAAAGWGSLLAVAGGNSRSLAATSVWCVPE